MASSTGLGWRPQGRAIVRGEGRRGIAAEDHEAPPAYDRGREPGQNASQCWAGGPLGNDQAPVLSLSSARFEVAIAREYRHGPLEIEGEYELRGIDGVHPACLRQFPHRRHEIGRRVVAR